MYRKFRFPTYEEALKIEVTVTIYGEGKGGRALTESEKGPGVAFTESSKEATALELAKFKESKVSDDETVSNGPPEREVLVRPFETMTLGQYTTFVENQIRQKLADDWYHW